MPQSTHDRAAELHNLAAHAHTAAAAALDNGDHLSAHELTRKALEQSMNAYKHAEDLVAQDSKSDKTGIKKA